MWDPAPDKYKTRCTMEESDEIIFERVYEAISESEAEARAFLNCVMENNKNMNVKVEAKRL